MNTGIGRELYIFAYENGYEKELLIIIILVMTLLIILAKKFKNKEK